MNTCHGKRHLPYPGDSVPHFQDEVWTPDLALRNSFTEHVPLGYPQLFVHNDYHGNVRWKPFQVCTSGYQPSGVYSVPWHLVLSLAIASLTSEDKQYIRRVYGYWCTHANNQKQQAVSLHADNLLLYHWHVCIFHRLSEWQAPENHQTSLFTSC